MALVTSAAASLKNTWGFSPQSIPGLQLWLDGADRSSMVFSGTTVTTWNDKSGNGLHATATGTPTYTSNALNGLGAPALNSNANFFKTPTFIISPTVGTPSIFMIMNQTAYSGSGNSDFFQSTNSWQRLDFFGQGNSFNAAVTMNNAGPTLINATTTSNNPTLLSFVVNTASGGVGFANGTFTATVGSAGGLLVQTDTYSIGGGPGFVGFIYELIVFNNTVSTSQRQQVEGYLAAKWGLKANLPATHPYSATASVPFNRPFYPTDIPGCTLWMDAADRSSITLSSGSLTNISRWNDKSGQGNDFTVTEGTPVLSTTTIGNPGVFLPALSQMQSVSNAAENGAASRTSFFVADVPRLKEAQIGTGSIGNNFCVWGFDWTRKDQAVSNAMFNPYTWAVDIVFRSPVDGLTTTTNIGFAAYNSNTTTLTGNFNFSSSDSNITLTPNTTAGPWWMGDRPQSGTTGSNGTTADNAWICEFIQYSGVLTTQQRQQVESYLSWKWKTTTILPFPTGHPGKLLPAFGTRSPPNL